MPFKIIEGYRIGFYSSDEFEPPHVHVLRSGNEAKIWLEAIRLEYNHGYNQREMKRVLDLVREHQPHLLEMWHEHFKYSS